MTYAPMGTATVSMPARIAGVRLRVWLIAKGRSQRAGDDGGSTLMPCPSAATPRRTLRQELDSRGRPSAIRRLPRRKLAPRGCRLAYVRGVVGRAPVAAFRDTRTRVVASCSRPAVISHARSLRRDARRMLWQLHKLEKPRYSTRLDFKSLDAMLVPGALPAVFPPRNTPVLWWLGSPA